MNIDAARASFIAESRELIADMELALLACERGDFGASTVNAIFRAAHTIKGNAGLFGLDAIVSFTHVVESALDQVRDGHIVLDQEWSALLLECRDHMLALIEAVAAGGDGSDAQLAVWGKELIGRLGALGAFGGVEKQGSDDGERQLLDDAALCLRALLADPVDAARVDQAREVLARITKAQQADAPATPRNADSVANPCWHVSLRVPRDILQQGLDPLSFIRFLASNCRIERVLTVCDQLPAPEAFDPELHYLGYELRLDAATERDVIDTAFQFIREQSRLHVLAPHASLVDYATLLAALPEGVQRGRELLLASGALTAAEIERLDKPVGGEAVQAKDAVPTAPLEHEAPRSSEQQSIRVDAGKLESLINLVGELVIAGASAHLQAQRARQTHLSEAVQRVARLVESVRDETLKLRMTPIGATFARFSRVVRDVSRELGKEIRLETSGGDTELDKTLIEKITDPLTHLVRNAIDHGIETSALRSERGKHPVGTVLLNAYHDSGSVVIEVSDDGGGLNRDRILAKARERGLIESGDQLSDQEVFALIFEPGFSTADAVTNLSGRGVGMDVVKRNVTQLRGTVEISSVAGGGTTIRVRLPLTLAIIDGFLIRVGNTRLVVPLDAVEECLEVKALPPQQDDHRFIDLRGQVLPLICLGEHFTIQRSQARRQSIVVVRQGTLRAGLLVDELLGEHQIVIKPLARMFRRVRGLGGSTVLGDGAVALILDVAALIDDCRGRRSPRAA